MNKLMDLISEEVTKVFVQEVMILSTVKLLSLIVRTCVSSSVMGQWQQQRNTNVHLS